MATQFFPLLCAMCWLQSTIKFKTFILRGGDINLKFIGNYSTLIKVKFNGVTEQKKNMIHSLKSFDWVEVRTIASISYGHHQIRGCLEAVHHT